MTKPNVQFPNKTISEERCRERFERWLRTYIQHSHMSWEKEPNGPETAPDYDLNLDGKQFAVEVTCVMHHRVVEGKELPLGEIWSGLHYLTQKAEKACHSKGILRGIYVMCFSEPLPQLSESPNLRRTVVQQVIAYVTRTQSDYRALEEVISYNGVQICTILKNGNDVDGISCASSTSLTSGISLCELLKKTIEIKANKLKDVSLPRILLLDEQYCRDQPHTWYDCLDGYAPARAFHTIFVVRDIGYDFAIKVGLPGFPVLHRNSDVPTLDDGQ